MLRLNRIEAIEEGDIELRRESCKEELDEKLSAVDEQRQKRYKWRGRYKNMVHPKSALEQLNSAMKDPFTSQSAKLNGEHNSAIEYIVTKSQRKVNVKSERLVAACILSEAKLSINNFNKDFYETMQKYVDHLDYAPWVSCIKAIKVNVGNTDSDSLCFRLLKSSYYKPTWVTN